MNITSAGKRLSKNRNEATWEEVEKKNSDNLARIQIVALKKQRFIKRRFNSDIPLAWPEDNVAANQVSQKARNSG